MTVKREDLMAAAAAGLLPASQVDSMLIFLRRRDMLKQRERRGERDGSRQAGVAGRHILLYLLAVAALGAAVAALLMQAGLAFDPVQLLNNDRDAARLAAGVLATLLLSIALADRVERRRPGAAAGVLALSWLALAAMAGYVLFDAGMLRLPLKF